MIQNVSKNFDNFTGEENERAKLPCKKQSMAANPPDERFKNIVSGTSINNCPVEVNGVSNSSAIFGSNRNGLRGVSTRWKPKRLKEEYLKNPQMVTEIGERRK